jgi:hypothetical protein
MAKKKVKKTGLHREVSDIWGWAVLVCCVFLIFLVAGVYYLSFLSV